MLRARYGGYRDVRLGATSFPGSFISRSPMITPPIRTTTLIHFSSKGWENVLFEANDKILKYEPDFFSVLPSFRKRENEGQPVEVTDAKCIKFEGTRTSLQHRGFVEAEARACERERQARGGRWERRKAIVPRAFGFLSPRLPSPRACLIKAAAEERE